MDKREGIDAKHPREGGKEGGERRMKQSIRADPRDGILAGDSEDEMRLEEMFRKLDSCPKRKLPKRIILVRHGESQGNLDMSAYTTTPDYRIPLTPLGVEQARTAGQHIRRVVSGGCGEEEDNWKVYFYVSPYERTRSTLREIGRAFGRKRIIGVREECRIREQDFGNFQVEERMKAIKETRERFGRFFFRFPEGESAADVYDRVASKSLSFSHNFQLGIC